jgi:hypothetical protein
MKTGFKLKNILLKIKALDFILTRFREELFLNFIAN